MSRSSFALSDAPRDVVARDKQPAVTDALKPVVFVRSSVVSESSLSPSVPVSSMGEVADCDLRLLEELEEDANNTIINSE